MMVSPSRLGDKTGSVKFFDPQRGFGNLAVTPAWCLVDVPWGKRLDEVKVWKPLVLPGKMV